ncbi:MAG: hypothetical protein ACRDQA_02885 [Nocardioidaceae bacterium]
MIIHAIGEALAVVAIFAVFFSSILLGVLVIAWVQVCREDRAAYLEAAEFAKWESEVWR